MHRFASDVMKGLAMKTAVALALAVFCFLIGAQAVHGEDIVTEPIRTFSGHSGAVASVAFSPDGAKVLTGSYDNTARLWDAATGVIIRSFSHSGRIKSVAFSPDGTKVLTGADWPDNTANLWDAATGSLTRTFSGHTDWVYSVAFSPDGMKVLTGSRDGTAKLWWTNGNWPILGDANGDCVVSILALIFIRNKLNQNVATGDNRKADVNNDARINILDLIFVRNKLGTRCQ